MFYILFFVVLLLLFIFGYSALDFRGKLTGMATGTGTVTLTQAGSAGITISDSAIAFGSGYYQGNGTCSAGNTFSTLDSNLTYGNSGSNPLPFGSVYCWVNTTAVSNSDSHLLVNSGSTIVNVSAYSDQKDANTLFCGSSSCALSTTVARVQLLSYSSESLSCGTGVTAGYENLLTSSTNATVGICDTLDFADATDSVVVYANFSVPKDAAAGAKTLTITYTATAV
ncbi:hypothetical protein HZA98_02560 [Candidatus Woesearchaeota archaeon]|nr:hypothetical protein [Candidatus Woesearchaeota archaeon]